MDWIIFTLLAYFTWSITSIIDKFIVSKKHVEDPIIYSIVNGVSGLLVLILVPIYGFKIPPLNILLIALLTGIFYILLVIPFYKACQYEEISRIQILWQMMPIFALILATIFLNEILSLNDYIGFVLLIIGGIIVSLKKIKGIFKLNIAFYLILFATFIAAIHAVLSKYIFTNADLVSGFVLTRMGAFLMSMTFFISNKYRKISLEIFSKMSNKIKTVIGIKAIIDLAALLIFSYALITGPVSLISVIGNAIKPIFVLILAFFITVRFPNIIKEDLSIDSLFSKIIALVLVLAGLYFVYI